MLQKALSERIRSQRLFFCMCKYLETVPKYLKKDCLGVTLGDYPFKGKNKSGFILQVNQKISLRYNIENESLSAGIYPRET